MMVNKLISATLLGCSLMLALSGAALGERAYDLPAFDAIDAAGNFEVVVSVGGAQAVVATSEGGDLDDLVLEVDGTTLEVRNRQDAGLSRTHTLAVAVQITLPQLTRLSAAAGVEMDVIGVDADRFEIRAVTGAELTVAGRCGDVKLSVNTGGVAEASRLQCASAKASANTGGVASVYASTAVDASANTGGEIDVYGNPQQVQKRGRFGGEVALRGDGG